MNNSKSSIAALKAVLPAITTAVIEALGIALDALEAAGVPQHQPSERPKKPIRNKAWQALFFFENNRFFCRPTADYVIQ